MPELLLDRNDNAIRLHGGYVVDLATGDPIYLTADATIEITVLDLTTASAIDGPTWPVSLSYIAGSRGDFIGVLSDSMDVIPGQALRGVVVGDNGTDQHFERDMDILVVRPRV